MKINEFFNKNKSILKFKMGTEAHGMDIRKSKFRVPMYRLEKKELVLLTLN